MWLIGVLNEFESYMKLRFLIIDNLPSKIVSELKNILFIDFYFYY